MRDGPYGDATGYACPRCGGGLWRRDDGDDGDGAAGPRCRIGHAFRPEQPWIEHCAARNRALAEATRALAENAALARAMADEARALGNDALAARLQDEAQSEERHAAHLAEMLEDIAPGDLAG